MKIKEVGSNFTATRNDHVKTKSSRKKGRPNYTVVGQTTVRTRLLIKFSGIPLKLRYRYDMKFCGQSIIRRPVALPYVFFGKYFPRLY